MTSDIHPTAIVDSRARLGQGVRVGPFCLIGPDVEIGDGCELISHAVVVGRTRMGRKNRVFPFASIGHEPQDLKYHGEPSEVVIGDGNTIRESVTINPGTEGGGMVTRIGNQNLIMAYSHVAHDCCIGNRVVLANCATLAGHVEIDDEAIIGGLAAIHQFVRIGRLAIIGGKSAVHKDVPPFCMLKGGYHASLRGLNLVGLRRHGFDAHRIKLLKSLYKTLFATEGRVEQRILEAENLVGGDPDARCLLDFVRDSRRGCSMHGQGKSDSEVA